MRPLSGIRVIEFCSVAAGPFCAMLLADMGADVIKVENPDGGDTMRAWPPMSGDYSENFASLNRNKRSVTLDLKDPTDKSRARELIRSADVVLENNRPGVMQRLGLDYATVSADRPALVYCSISAYGQEGPRSKEAGFDLTLQAMSGVMSVTGEPGAPPVKCGVPISDFGTGLYAAYAIAAALFQARATGKGTHIDASMFGATLAMGALQTSEYFGSGRDPRRLGSAHPRNAPYQAFRAQDGYFAMAAGNNALYRSACNAIERPDLFGDPRFASTALRAQHQGELLDILERIFADFTCENLLARFRAAGVPCSPINSYSEALADPQVEHMGWVQPVRLPSGVETRTFVSPLRFSGEGFPIYRDPPALGEHNEEVFGVGEPAPALARTA
ncbi:CaiB/BaiF CoA transferase family protein [Methylobacterium oxalidis]|uniref:CoA transferase n=1 Tax=Methylobacterium oxalidis TaxID=944322 RepID=A0A512JAB9_9HYPH|nr:CoA transferase [Methylobacterium oxalidis]GEP06910.1 CoA transferase [Methylobacterium oxalidis]GJE33103.1 Acetyl-CoA:oxalate CoA-transferase [Methylobacterium oxalidis]GLS64399.1 CoA transferase [Methylobacterium oxalidis]